MPEGWYGEPGPSGFRWHQGAGQCLTTQGHEPRADAQGREGTGEGDQRLDSEGRDPRCAGRPPLPQGESELRHKQGRLARIRQARKEMEAETAAAAARQRQEEEEAASAKAAEAPQADAPATEQAELQKTAEAAAAKAKAAREKAIEAAEHAGVEPPDLEPLAADAMPRRGLARKADGTPTTKAQRNFTDPDSHLMQSCGTDLQGYNCQVALDSDHQVIVAVGVSSDIRFWSRTSFRCRLTQLRQQRRPRPKPPG